MPFKETAKEKEKREAYYKANKERGIRAEKKKEYEMFGTTEQNIPNVNPMGDVVTPAATGMKKGVSTFPFFVCKIPILAFVFLSLQVILNMPVFAFAMKI
mgnify:CR=1 FL=1